MSVTKVTTYQTSKGEIHRTKAGAELAEKLDIMEVKLEEFVEENFFRDMADSQIVSMMLENRVELLRILG